MRYVQFVFLVSVAAVFFTQIASAQLMPVDQFDQPINNEDLPSASIRTLFQDSQGFIWIGTTTNLLLYDGKDLYDLKHDPNDKTSISNIWISTHGITEHAGYVWVATKNGLNRYDPDTKKFKQYFTNTNSSSQACSPNMNALAPPKTSNRFG
ncbi:MAG: two-component regulator propeller domain-containing protein [Bacteroidota bacterium]